MIEIKNGDLVKYRKGLTFMYVGLNPLDPNYAYCIHPSAIDKNDNIKRNRVDVLLLKDLELNNYFLEINHE